MKKLVIVESPTKAKTIGKFLGNTSLKGDSFVIDSSMGHVRDLPSKASEIPEKFKQESWSSIGINVDEDFQPLYITPPDKKKVVTRLKKELKEADELILATDEDREGEAISWHLLEVLKPKVPVKRMVFHEITKEAILHALENPREVDHGLVNAQEARRILDRLVGYSVSPVLWKRIAPSLSAGRVQSVAVELIVDRERERMRFRKGLYFDLKALLDAKGSEFEAQLSQLNGKRIAGGKDFNEQTGQLNKPDSVVLLDEAKAAELLKKIEPKASGTSWTVESLTTRTESRKPAPPFTTSTLQQEANRKLNLGARDTMRVAQSLYENGYITYMRTDSMNLSSQAIEAARNAVKQQYGTDYLSDSIRSYGSSKGAQEAHEAIRPAGSVFPKPSETPLKGIELRLYDLIWKRTLATQMANAQLEFTAAEIMARNGDTEALFKASGKRTLFPGFIKAYFEGSDDPDAAIESKDTPLPPLNEQQKVDCTSLESLSHETKPPARYTEATLVKGLEKEGIGRPSTYASIISTIQDRNYVAKVNNQLIPTFTAFAVTGFLEGNFPDLVDRHFTSEMENQLDEIAQGKRHPIQYLKDFYHGENGLQKTVEMNEKAKEGENARELQLPLQDLDASYHIHIGKYGPYVTREVEGETQRASIPETIFPADLTSEKLDELIALAAEGPQSLGQDPETNLDVFVLTGRFGPYVQLGMPEEGSKEKPKRTSLPKGLKPEDVDLETALGLLSLPRTIGQHPETDKVVKAGIGRFGPFILYDGTYASLKAGDDVLTVDMERALQLLAEKAARGGKTAQEVLKEVGEHPEDGKPIQVLNGRYGPYVKHGRTNAGIPKGSDPKAITLEAALELIQVAASKKKGGRSKGRAKKK